MLHQLVRDICSKERTTGAHVPLLRTSEWAQSEVWVHTVNFSHHRLKNAPIRMCSTVSHAHREEDEKGWEKWFASLSAESIEETNEDTAVKAKQLPSLRWGNRRVWITEGTLPLLVKQVIHQIASAGIWPVLINISKSKKTQWQSSKIVEAFPSLCWELIQDFHLLQKTQERGLQIPNQEMERAHSETESSAAPHRIRPLCSFNFVRKHWEFQRLCWNSVLLLLHRRLCWWRASSTRLTTSTMKPVASWSADGS